MNALRSWATWAWAVLRARPVLATLVLLLAGLLAVFVAVGVSGPAWVHAFFGVKEGTDKFRILEFVGVGMGGVLLAIGAAIAHRRAVAMEDAAKAQAKAAEAQAKAAKAQAEANKGAENGRRQERLKNAIEHLGHESDSVRLGGAYELFHLARDTEELRQTAMDILCAHIRRTTGETEYREKYKAEPSEEVQSLLTLLFRQKHEVFTGYRVDLQGSWLNGAMLDRARLQGASLSRAQLQGANLPEAQLQGANVREAYLQGANLARAQLQGANLREVHLQGASLYRAQLQGADLREAQLQGANVREGHLQRASLYRAQLQGASFRGAQLQEANLSGAQLQGANVREGHLQRASLYRAQLQGASFRGAHLQGANLSRAQLQGATSKPAGGLSFVERIRRGIGWESDLSKATFAGGLRRENVDSLVENLPDERAKSLREKLEPHIGKLASHELPKDHGAVIGAYTEEEAERWIAEYSEAVGEG